MKNDKSLNDGESILPRIVQFSSMPKKGQFLKITLNADESAAMCAFYNLLGIDSFKAEISITRKTTNKFIIKGSLKALVIQPCVVSFEPVETNVDEIIDTFLIPASEIEHYMEKADEEGSLVLDVDEDVPDTYQNDNYDIGALILEYFAIGLTPYPQAENVELDKRKLDVEKKVSPFAELAQLKDKLQKN